MKQKICWIGVAFLAVVLLLGAGSFHRAFAGTEAMKWRLQSVFPGTSLGYEMLVRDFIKDVQEKTGGRLTIKEWADAGQVIVTVSDTGPGVAVEDRSRIFEPFFTTKEPGEASGLGLAISYEIAKHHDGDLALVDTDQPGATFALTLPNRPTVF